MTGGVTAFAQRAEYLPLELLDPSRPEGGIRLWKFDLYPSVSAGGEYNDNVTYLRTGGSSDFVWSLSPSITAVAGTVKRLSLTYTPSAHFYTRNSDYTRLNHGASLGLAWPMAKLSLNFGATYSDTLSADVVVGSMAQSRSLSLTVGASYPWTEKISTSHNVRFSFQDYGNYYGTAAVPSGGLIGYLDWGTDHWARYRYSEKTGFSLGVSVGQQNAQRNGVDSVYERVLASVDYSITEKLSATLAVGPEFRQYSGDTKDSLGLTFNASGSWQPTDRTGFSLSANRSQTPSPIVGGENYVNTSVSLGVTQRLFDRIGANASIGYSNVSSGKSAAGASTGRDDDYIFGRIGFSLVFARKWSFSVHYERRESLSDNTASYAFSNNRAGFDLTWRY
ncbi:outer membrane beta-barrel protein [Fontisphaera persica]|uniref:outer membrane beta-barrel protein n=1 Tax=Fontisphaera persica TaxID=2974023 RepID=UPI0024BFB4B7|nr:outer membrane beta-barrel protein [Fontisphaera persica]WCJ59677.1 outer membrane beta-barrel protein [Fontisphaera persica]